MLRSFKQRAQRLVFNGGEVKLLIGVEVHLLRQHAELHRVEGRRTLSDDDDVGPVFALDRLAEPACGQQFVVDDQTVIVYQQDIQSGFDITMLIGIIEEDGIYLFLGVRPTGQMLDASFPFGIDGHIDSRIFLFHLIGLVAKVAQGRLGRGQQETSAFPLVAAAQYCHVEMAFQQSDQIFHVGRFPRAAYGDVTHRDDRCRVGALFQDSHLKEKVPESHAQAVEPTQGQQFLVQFNEVALHFSLLTFHFSLLTFHFSLHPNIVEHTGLDATVVLEVVADLHQRLIEIT